MIYDKKLVALCTSRIFDPHILGFIETLNKKLHENNCILQIFTINSDQYWNEESLSAECAVFDVMPYDNLDLIIIMDERIKSRTISKRIISRSKTYNIPVIVVDGNYDETISIIFDYKSGFEKVVRHVVEDHRIKNPHLMAGIPGNSFSDERINVFKNVLKENNITFDDSMISYGLFWATPAREETEKIINSGRLPEAIICANDIMAINVCDILMAHGYSVPDDIIITGFDGYEEVFFTNPRITTVSCNCISLSEATASTAIKLLKRNKVKNLHITPELIPNESCGCPSDLGYSQAILNRFNDSFYRYQDDLRKLYDVATKMHTCQNPRSLAECFNDENFQNLFCVVKKNCFNPSKNILTERTSGLLFHDLYLVHDSKDPDLKIQKVASSFPLHWNKEAFEEFWESGQPLIYNAIDYMNKALGFVCYSYNESTITNYVKTSSMTSTISMGIGGFINMRYQHKLSDRMGEMYKKDALTGLYNRIGFQQIYNKLSSSKKNHGKPITVIMSDLDGLKYINDNFGHAEGDRAIAEAAHFLKRACPERAICTRFGGDELFAVIIGKCDIDKIISKIKMYMDEFNSTSRLEYSVIASYGANTSILNDSFDLKDALRIADEQMYQIKKNKHKV